MATKSEGWNGFIGGMNDVAGVVGNLGNAVNAWKNTTPTPNNTNPAENNSSLDSLAASLAQSAKNNQKMLIIGGIGIAAAVALFLVFKK